MNYIVAFDGSAESKSALKSAISMAAHSNATVTALYAIERFVRADDCEGNSPILEGLDAAEDRAALALREATDFAEQLDATIETETVYGHPGASIIEYVESTEATAIYVGHRPLITQKSGIGSVAQMLIRNSPVPVTVVN